MRYKIRCTCDKCWNTFINKVTADNLAAIGLLTKRNRWIGYTHDIVKDIIMDEKLDWENYEIASYHEIYCSVCKKVIFVDTDGDDRVNLGYMMDAAIDHNNSTDHIIINKNKGL